MADDVEEVVKMWCERCGGYVGAIGYCVKCAEADGE
jgi:hypothetical protein